MKELEVLSLYDLSGNMVQPWAEEGYRCHAIDWNQENERVESVGDGEIHYINEDIRKWLPPRTEYRIVFAFPPCQNMAVSGARWFKDKGLSGLAEGIELVERARYIAEWADCPWMIENPVSTLSTHWREPDYKFHPYHYDEYAEGDEAYSKQTCLWTSEDFVLPKKTPVEKYDERIHKMPPSEDRSQKRSITPRGFAKAVFKANEKDDIQAGEFVQEVDCW